MQNNSKNNSINRQQEHFDSIADKYYAKRQGENHQLYKRLLWSFFFKNKEHLFLSHSQVLEPMCGFAEAKKIFEEILKIKIDYEGFDYSKPLVDIVKNDSNDINIWVQDVTTFEADKLYDIIVIIGGLHHIPNYASKVLRSMSDALKPTGYFINIEPTNDNFLWKGIRDYIYKRNSLFDEHTERSFTLNELNGMYNQACLKIVDQLHFGLLSHVLYYNPDAFPLLNIGGKRCVSFTFWLDKFFFRSFIGRKLSFATLTMLSKH